MARFTSVITQAELADPSATTSHIEVLQSNAGAWDTIHDQAWASSAAGAVTWGGGWDIEVDSATTGLYAYIGRTGLVFYLGDTIPESASIISATLNLGLESLQTQVSAGWSAADLGRVSVKLTRFAPFNSNSTSTADYNQSRMSVEIGSVAGSVITGLTTPSYFSIDLNAAGVQWLQDNKTKVGLGLRWGWDFNDTEPSFSTNENLSAYGGTWPGGLPVSLSVTYETPSAPIDVTRRRFELPVEPSRFVPVRRSTRYGAPLSLQDVRAARVELPSQTQDYLNEMPPFLLRNVAVTPNSQVTAQAGTVLVTPSTTSAPIWYKRYGSGNTGWQELMGAGDYRGLLSDFQKIQYLSPDSSGTTYTLPSAVDSANTMYVVKNMTGLGPVHVAATVGSVESEGRVTLVSKYDSATFVSDSTNWWII